MSATAPCLIRECLVKQIYMYVRLKISQDIGHHNLYWEVVRQSVCLWRESPLTVQPLPGSGYNETEVLTRSQGPEWLVFHQKIGKLVRSQAIMGLKSEPKDLILYPLFNRGLESQRSL